MRYACAEAAGLVKTISLFGGVSWVEVLLNEGTAVYWEFDDPRNFAADGPTPGKYLFSTGATGEVGKQADVVCVDVSTPRCAPFGEQQPYAALVHGASSSDVTLTVVAGRVLYDWGEWKTMDPLAVVEDAQREGAALLGRGRFGARS